jgi:hypothetical protein
VLKFEGDPTVGSIVVALSNRYSRSGAQRPAPHRVAIAHLLQGKQRLEIPVKI